MTPRPIPGTYGVCGFAADGARRYYFTCPNCWFEWIEEVSTYVNPTLPYSRRCPAAECNKSYGYSYATWNSGDPEDAQESYRRLVAQDTAIPTGLAAIPPSGSGEGDIDGALESESAGRSGERGEPAPILGIRSEHYRLAGNGSGSEDSSTATGVSGFVTFVWTR